MCPLRFLESSLIITVPQGAIIRDFNHLAGKCAEDCVGHNPFLSHDKRSINLLPPLECCRGTSPIHAASSRPDLKVKGSAIVPVMAEAVIGPIPGMVASRRLTARA